MNASAPHFLLFSESARTAGRGQWRFVLQSLDGTDQVEAADTETDVQGERLELLAVVRGLEMLPQPSRVTLVTPSRYVNRGLNYGLSEWRTNDWQWEHFGQMAPIKNRDLWQRIDRAMEFHSIECRPWQFEGERRKGELAEGRKGDGTRLDAVHNLAGPHFRVERKVQPMEGALAASVTLADECSGTEPEALSKVKSPERAQKGRYLGCQFRRRWIKLLRKFERTRESVWLRFSQLGTRLIPPPWTE